MPLRGVKSRDPDDDAATTRKSFPREIEPPWDENATHDSVVAGLSFGTDDEEGSMGIYSNDSDDGRIWEVAAALFIAVGDAIGAREAEMDPAEAMGWDPSAILKPPKS